MNQQTGQARETQTIGTDEVGNLEDVVEVEKPTAPEGMMYYQGVYHFKGAVRTEENLSKLPQMGALETQTADHKIEWTETEEEDDKGTKTGVVKFQRNAETYNLLVPLIESFGYERKPVVEGGADKEGDVLQYFIRKAVYDFGKKLAKDGITVTDDNCNWDVALNDLYDFITASTSAAQQFPKALLQDIGALFAEYSKSVNKPELGIVATIKMITARFNRTSTRPYIKAMEDIKTNIETWFLDGLDGEQQTKYNEVMEYLLDCIVECQKPEVEVDVGSMF